MNIALVCWLGDSDLAQFQETSGKRGPIHSTLEVRGFKQLHLLYNQALLKRYNMDSVEPYAVWLEQCFNLKVSVCKAQLESPVHYGDIYKAANSLLTRLVEALSKNEISVLLSPGTPQMHAVWLLMCKTSFDLPMLEWSEEQGVIDVDMPFDIAADFIPNLLAESDATLRRLASGQTATPPAFAEIITQSLVMKAQIIKAQKIAERDIPVLILGESGTGKELFARAIHEASRRGGEHGGRLVPVNCGALSPELVDSELFGFKEGTFTGAKKDKVGYFEAADGGTIFLDEFGELPADTQVRLMRVLNDGTFVRVGDTEETKVDVRVIAATNRDLVAEMVEGNFREDLFYRVAVGVINLPPLRERAGDLMLLTDKLFEDINGEELDLNSDYKHKKLSAKARNVIKSHGWPGNIRELQSSLTRASVWSRGETVTEQEMREALLERPAKAGDLLGRSLDNTFDIHSLIKELKRHYIKKAMAETGGSLKKSADKLRLNSYQTLSKWMTDTGVQK